MTRNKWHWAAGPLVFTIGWGALPLLAADGGAAERPAARPGGKLVPFPEDEKAAPPVQRRSDFQPRFKPPAVRQAQHLEPVTSGEPANSESRPVSAAGEASDSPGRAQVEEAFAKSQASASEADYTAVIDLCRRGMDAGLNKSFEDYARRLMGWAYNRRGEAHAKAGNDRQALADFEAAVEAGGSWRAIHNRGVSYAALGRIDEAMTDLDRAIELNKRYPNAYFNRGELKYKQGDFAGALADYSTALELNPKDSAMLNSRGHALYRLERFGEALRDYGEAIKSDPENVAALINRGDTYSDLGQYSEAAKDYRAAVRIAPKMARAYHAVAWFMATCPDAHYRNEKLATEAAQKAIELEGETYRNLSTLAATQASAGLFDEAKQTQEKAIQKAAQREVVTAEKMMALYQRDLAFRERPRTAYTPLEEAESSQVQQASGTEPARPPKGKWPARQAAGTEPARPSGRPPGRMR